MYLPLDRILEQAGTMRGLNMQREYTPGEGARAQPQSDVDANSRARQSR
jgi:hypothetical protein